ncbi:MAG: aryl-sulfate sulfotransferase [Myxococcales bacterium]|nr:aryl-sulfate sulfotransferase [Myxococcales bacterium]
MRWMGWTALVVTMGCVPGKPVGTTTTDPGENPPSASNPQLPDVDCAHVVTDVTDERPANFLARRLTVTTDVAGAVWAACRPAGDPADVLLVESFAAATEHVLDVSGLTPDADWSCTVAPTCLGAEGVEIGWSTPPLPDNLPGFSVTGTPTGVWTLLNTQQSPFAGYRQYAIIVDPQGRTRWLHDLGSTYITDVDATWTGQVVHIGGGWGLFDLDASHRGVMQQVDLMGEVQLERTPPTFGLGYNHHSEPMSDGQVLSLTTSADTDGSDTWLGVAVERFDPSTDDVTWSWSSQQLYDDGTVLAQDDSPWAANALRWTTDAHGDALWLSLYTGEAMWRIDRATGQRTHVFSPDGDFTLVDTDGETLPDSEFAYRQHDPDFTDDGRVLLYDNGVGRPGGSYSRVSEYQLDLDANVATLLWTWTEEGWFTPVIGDADYLPSGNVLITKGVVRGLTPHNPQPSALIELDPESRTVVWRMDFDQSTYSVYRSQRYDGCEIFASAAHCPAVAERLGQLEAL